MTVSVTGGQLYQVVNWTAIITTMTIIVTTKLRPAAFSVRSISPERNYLNFDSFLNFIYFDREIRDPRAFNPAHNYTLGDLSWWLIGLGERSLCWKFFWNGNLRMGVQNQINFQFWFRSLERLKMHRDWVTTWKNKRDKLDIAVVLPGLRAGGRNFSSWKVAVSLENLFLGFMMCAAGCVTWVLLMSRPKFGRKGNHKPDQIMINNWD